jgi:hypothetical protein
MEKNFTDRNRGGKMDSDGSEPGFRMIDMSDENGYGSTDKSAVTSVPSGTYNPQPKSAEPINYSGVEDFGDERFSGGSPLGRTEASAPGKKDSIDTMGDGDNTSRSF